MEVRKIAVVVQGRLNSTRVPQKMIRPFGNSNLFEIALNKLMTSMFINTKDIFVSVGEEPLLEIAKKFPYEIYLRSKESCDSTNNPNIPDSLTLLYPWYNFLQEKGYTHVVLVSACNPLLSIETIDKFYRTFEKTENEGLFSVIKKKNFYWDINGEPITDWEGAYLMNTKKVKPIYEAAHCLYGSKLSFIENEMWMGNTSPPKPEMFEVSGIESFDIDTEEDFELVETLYKKYER